MSRYQPYPSYKDSGVEWLWKAPEHWNSVSLKWISKIYSGGTPDKTNLSYWDEGTIPWLASGEVNQFYITTPTTYITEDAYSKSSAKWISKDALVMALAGQGKTKGMVAQLGIETTCNQSMAAIVLSEKIHPRFILWWLNGNYENIRNLAGGDLRDGLNLELLGGILCPFMELSEQITIANFLDIQTAKIDTLIAKQQRMIELLGEKRSAMISHAVTKGLNPDVAMKDSGVDWLGEVPEHWIRSNIGFETIVKARLGWKGLKAEEYVEDGYIFLATPNIKNSEIDFENVNYITRERYEESPEIMLEKGDVLVTKDGSTTGTTNIVRELPRPATVNSSIAVIRPKDNIDSLYLYYFFVSTFIQETINLMRGGMGVPHLFQGDLRKFDMLVPPKAEQIQIANYLDIQTIKIDTLIAKAKQVIELMKERRTALISAAVTGKIDVRGIT